MNPTSIPLEAGYSANFDNLSEHEWYQVIDQFSDANIYQAWAYDANRCGKENLSHFVLREADKIVAAAQARIVGFPLLGASVAYIRWGPFWQVRERRQDLSVLRLAVRALRNEYVCRRGLILRIVPILFDDSSDYFIKILQEEGYVRVSENERQHTLVLDIGQHDDDIRRAFHQKWRNCLNKAERNHLEVIEGTDDHLFASFIEIYRELLKRKRFTEPNDINEFRLAQQELPDKLKLRIFLCRSNGVNSAAAICSAIGETGLYLFGAVNDQGMADKGSYLVQWKAIQWMKEKGCRYYNLNGINPSANPGTYHFKVGLAGKNSKNVQYLGCFDCYSGPTNLAVARLAELVLPFIKRFIVKRKLHSA